MRRAFAVLVCVGGLAVAAGLPPVVVDWAVSLSEQPLIVTSADTINFVWESGTAAGRVEPTATQGPPPAGAGGSSGHGDALNVVGRPVDERGIRGPILFRSGDLAEAGNVTVSLQSFGSSPSVVFYTEADTQQTLTVQMSDDPQDVAFAAQTDTSNEDGSGAPSWMILALAGAGVGAVLLAVVGIVLHKGRSAQNRAPFKPQINFATPPPADTPETSYYRPQPSSRRSTATPATNTNTTVNTNTATTTINPVDMYPCRSSIPVSPLNDSAVARRVDALDAQTPDFAERLNSAVLAACATPASVCRSVVGGGWISPTYEAEGMLDWSAEVMTPGPVARVNATPDCVEPSSMDDDAPEEDHMASSSATGTETTTGPGPADAPAAAAADINPSTPVQVYHVVARSSAMMSVGHPKSPLASVMSANPTPPQSNTPTGSTQKTSLSSTPAQHKMQRGGMHADVASVARLFHELVRKEREQGHFKNLPHVLQFDLMDKTTTTALLETPPRDQAEDAARTPTEATPVIRAAGPDQDVAVLVASPAPPPSPARASTDVNDSLHTVADASFCTAVDTDEDAEPGSDDEQENDGNDDGDEGGDDDYEVDGDIRTPTQQRAESPQYWTAVRPPLRARLQERLGNSLSGTTTACGQLADSTPERWAKEELLKKRKQKVAKKRRGQQKRRKKTASKKTAL